MKRIITGLLLATTVLFSCGKQEEQYSEPKQVMVRDSGRYTYIYRGVEDLRDEEQLVAYQYARDKALDAIKNSRVGQIPGTGTLIDSLKEVDISEQIQQLRIELAQYQKRIKKNSEEFGRFSIAWPKAFILHIGIPASALSISSGIDIYYVVRPFKVTRINKVTMEVDDSWSNMHFSRSLNTNFLKIGGGTPTGAGFGMRIGIGAVWGDLQLADQFYGTTLSAAYSPATPGAGPYILGGALWRKDFAMKRPDVIFVVPLGVEFGAFVKVNEAHGHIQRMFPIWKVLRNMLAIEDLPIEGEFDIPPDTLVTTQPSGKTQMETDLQIEKQDIDRAFEEAMGNSIK